MSVVYFSFKSRYCLNEFVSRKNPAENPKTPPSEWLPAVNNLPETSGIYVIINQFAKDRYNSYVGIATNLKRRFSSRHEAACTLGLTVETMEKIYVWHGTVQVWDTPIENRSGVIANIDTFNYFKPTASVDELQEPPAYTRAPLAGSSQGIPRTLIGMPRPFSSFPIAHIDNGSPINVEHLLIRYYISAYCEANTNTNTTLSATPFENKCQNPIYVYIDYAQAFGRQAQNIGDGLSCFRLDKGVVF